MSTIHNSNVIYRLKLAVKWLMWQFYYRHGDNFYCPVCEKSALKFRKLMRISICMSCHSLDRSRFTWLFFKRKTELFDQFSKQLLHVAPEYCFVRRLKDLLKENYVTADLYSPRAMINMDIADIGLDDQTFDYIYCSHVLEHVKDDHKALSEFYRILKNDGWAILLVPIDKGLKNTYEDFSITDPKERLKHYGQYDHVRVYGMDFIDRLKRAGFKVQVTKPKDFLSEKDISFMGLGHSGEIYFCKK